MSNSFFGCRPWKSLPSLTFLADFIQGKKQVSRTVRIVKGKPPLIPTGYTCTWKTLSNNASSAEDEIENVCDLLNSGILFKKYIHNEEVEKYNIHRSQLLYQRLQYMRQEIKAMSKVVLKLSTMLDL